MPGQSAMSCKIFIQLFRDTNYHLGLSTTDSWIQLTQFFFLSQPLIVFSRDIASWMSNPDSKYTSFLML